MKFTSESAAAKWRPDDVSTEDLDRGFSVVPVKSRPEYACNDRRLGIAVEDGMPVGQEETDLYDD